MKVFDDLLGVLTHNWSAKFGELLVGVTRDAIGELEKRVIALEQKAGTAKAEAPKAPEAPAAPEAPKAPDEAA